MKSRNSKKRVWVVGVLVLCVPFILQAETDYLSRDFGLPAIESSEQIVRHFAYTLQYSEEHEQARWVSYVLTPDRVDGKWKRTDKFIVDPLVTTGTADKKDYKGSRHDRGHLAPAGDMKWDSLAMYESFYFSNMSPQKPKFNRIVWRNLEGLVRQIAVDHEVTWVVTGPVLTDGLKTIGENEVSIPQYYYKVVLTYKNPELKGMAWVLPNEKIESPIGKFCVTIDSVENLTGIDFFPLLPDPLEDDLESKTPTRLKYSCIAPYIDPDTVIVTVPVIKYISVPVETESTTESYVQPKVSNDYTVYITKTGSKYHRGSCSYLRSSKIPISKAEAIRRGYGACSRCNP